VEESRESPFLNPNPKPEEGSQDKTTSRLSKTNKRQKHSQMKLFNIYCGEHGKPKMFTNSKKEGFVQKKRNISREKKPDIY
jgi:hypothetical protein